MNKTIFQTRRIWLGTHRLWTKNEPRKASASQLPSERHSTANRPGKKCHVGWKIPRQIRSKDGKFSRWIRSDMVIFMSFLCILMLGPGFFFLIFFSMFFGIFLTPLPFGHSHQRLQFGGWLFNWDTELGWLKILKKVLSSKSGCKFLFQTLGTKQG